MAEILNPSRKPDFQAFKAKLGSAWSRPRERRRKYRRVLTMRLPATAGDKELERQLLQKGADADAHLSRMLNDQATYAENLDRALRHYTAAELKALRTHQPIQEAMFLKIVDNILDMAAFLFRANPNIAAPPPARELPYTFIFRYALTGYLLALRWMSVGGAKKTKLETIRNDIVDATLAAYATYFQDLLSNDVKAKRFMTMRSIS
jgi:hypothetical protein